MRLNNDCIRDILLYIEDKITYKNSCIEVSSLLNDLSKYTEDEILYHINQIYKADLIDKPFYADDRAQIISDLTWTGHQYVDNIRDNKVWKLLKEKSKTLSSISLSTMVKLAPTIIEHLLSMS